MHSKSRKIPKLIEKIDSINNSDRYHNLYDELCGCKQLHKFFSIYHRFVIKKQIFHSLFYAKCGKSISDFVQYLFAQCYYHFGTIECFFSLQSKEKLYAFINMCRVKHKYRGYFEQSKYYHLLKELLDNFFFILEKYSFKKEAVPTDFILKHCIIFYMNNSILVTPVSTYDEHD